LELFEVFDGSIDFFHALLQILEEFFFKRIDKLEIGFVLVGELSEQIFEFLL